MAAPIREIHLQASLPNRLRLLAFTLLMVLSFVAEAQQDLQNLRFRTINVDNGLPSNKVSYILQDRLGYVWVGTSAGLCRFDGYEMTVFTHDPSDSLTLPGNDITALFEDKDGKIWIGTGNTTIAYFDPYTGQLCKIPIAPGTVADSAYNPSLGAASIGPQWEDGFFLENHGKYTFYSKGKFNLLPKPERPMVDWFGKPMPFDDHWWYWGARIKVNNFLYFGIHSFDLKKWKGQLAIIKEDIPDHIFNDPNFSSHFTYIGSGAGAVLDGNGRIWYGSQDGLVLVARPNDGQLIPIKIFQTGTVKSIHFDRVSGKVLMGIYRKGIQAFDINTYESEWIMHDAYVPGSIPQSTPSALLRDRSGVLWVGTSDAGLAIASPNSARFTVHAPHPFKASTISNSFVADVLTDGQGTVWAATAQNVNSYDRDKHQWRQWARPDSVPYLAHIKALRNTTALMHISVDSLMYGTWGYGCFVLNTRTGRHTDLPYRPNTTRNQWNDIGAWVRDITHWRTQKRYISSLFGNALQSYSQSGPMSEFRGEWGVNSWFQSNPGTPLEVDTFLEGLGTVSLEYRSKLFYGSERGLYVYDSIGPWATTMAVRYFNHLNDSSISSGHILSLYQDTDHNLWVGTDMGLNMIRANSPIHRDTPFEKFPWHPVLAKGYITAIIQDKNHVFWIGTNKGLCRVRPDVEQCRCYGVQDGLPSNNILPNSIDIDADGTLFVGTDKGLVEFHPDNVVIDTVLLTPTLTDFQVMRQPYPMDTTITFKRWVSLRYFQNHLTFRFSALDHVNPLGIRYEYRLIGSDTSWAMAGLERSAVYSSLSPGEYVFEVRCTNNDGLWGPVRSFHISITPPFWQTWWFRTGSLALVLLAIGMFIRLRERQLKREKALLEKKVDERTAQLSHEKRLVETKNAEIMDSMAYARRLQEAVLPPVRVVRDFFAESFLIYLPKELVSGDFYWMESSGTKSYFAVGDCTGHGVPGAMLSVMALNSLNRSFNELGIHSPDELLDALNKDFLKAFQKSDTTVRDGMDIALCVIDNEHLTMRFSGALSPAWIFRDGEAHILTPDRWAIGHSEVTRSEFSCVTFNLKVGDTVYLFSDGFHSQLGGPEGRTIKRALFRELLSSVQDHTMAEQRAILLDHFTKWKGDQEQTDDICVLGIRINAPSGKG